MVSWQNHPVLTKYAKPTWHIAIKNISRSDRVLLVFAVLKGLALNYRMEQVDGRAEYSKSGDVFKALEARFDNSAHQKLIKAIAPAMKMDEVHKKHRYSRVAALGVQYHEVSRFNEQFPKVKRRPAFNMQILWKIVERHEWSRTAEEEIMQDNLIYDTLYIKLSAAIVTWEHGLAQKGRFRT